MNFVISRRVFKCKFPLALVRQLIILFGLVECSPDCENHMYMFIITCSYACSVMCKVRAVVNTFTVHSLLLNTFIIIMRQYTLLCLLHAS